MKHHRVKIVSRLIAPVGRSQLFIAIGIGLCCSAGLLLTASGKLNQAAYVDPYIYAGYVHDYPRLLARFGPTYYSERIAFVYPERVFAHLFGLEGGYFALRLAMLASAVAATFAIGLRFYGFAPALLAAVWLSFTPWLPRALLWTYPDGFAAVYVLVGTACLLVPTRKRLIGHVAAGAAFALSADCNLFLLAICGLLGPGWAFFYRRDGVVWLARAILALAVGFFGTYLVMALFLYIRFPGYGFSFELRSIQEALTVVGGQQQVWYEPLSTIIWEYHDFKLLIPVTLLLAAFAVVARRSMFVRSPTSHTDFPVLVISYLASIICLFLVFHFGLRGFVFSDESYTTYVVPGCVLALIVLGGEAELRGGRIVGAAAVYGGAGLILVWWLAEPVLPHSAIASNFYFWLAVAAVATAAAVALCRTAAASVVLVVGIVLLSTSLYQKSFYQIRATPHEAEATEWDVYRGAIFLQQFINANVSPNKSLGFWYTGDHQSFLNSIQSMYLWSFTRVFPPDGIGMPLVDKEFRDRITRGLVGLVRVPAPIRDLILLGLSDNETNAGLAALERAGLPLGDVEVKRTRFQGHLWGYTAVLIEMKSPARTLGPLSFDVPIANLNIHEKVSLSLASLTPSNGASVSLLADGLRLTTAAAQWSYSLTDSLRPELQSVHGAVVVRLRLQVEEGKVGVAVSTVGNISSLIREVGVDVAPQAQEVDLDLPDGDTADLLIVRNQSPSGRSRAMLYSVDLLRPK